MNINLVSPHNPQWQLILSNLQHDFYHDIGYVVLEGERINAQPQAVHIQQGECEFFLPYLLRPCSSDLSDSIEADVFDVISPYGYPSFIVNQAGSTFDFLHECFSILIGFWKEQGICSAFLRLHPIFNDYLLDPRFSQWDFLHIHGNSIVCDLALPTEQIWQQTRENHRTKIKKLKRQGFQASIVPSTCKTSFNKFIAIYEETMDRVNANEMYYFTEDYFAKLVQALQHKIHLCLVDFEGETIAASLITESSGVVQYHLGGTKSEFLKYSPTTLMFDHIREWAKSRDSRYFNLGGGLGSSEDSLYHFKLGFSKLTKPFMTMRIVVHDPIYQKFVNITAERKNVSASSLLDSTFFPAYRA